MSLRQAVSRQIVSPSPGLTTDDVIAILRTEIVDLAEAEARVVPITSSPGCDGQPIPNPLDGTSEPPDAGGLEVGIVAPGGALLPGGVAGGGVPGVAGDVNVGGRCYDADGMATDALCAGSADQAALDAEIGASVLLADEPPEVIASHVVVGYDGGTYPGPRYTGGAGPSPAASPAVILSFTASRGGVLEWSTAYAVTVSIDNGVGAVSENGTLTVAPDQTTTYTLTATGENGDVMTATVRVVAGPVLVDSAGNVFALIEDAGTYTAEYVGLAGFFGQPPPTMEGSMPGWLTESATPPIGAGVGYDGVQKMPGGSLEDCRVSAVGHYAWVPVSDFGDVTASGSVAASQIDGAGTWRWDTARAVTLGGAATHLALCYLHRPEGGGS